MDNVKDNMIGRGNSLMSNILFNLAPEVGVKAVEEDTFNQLLGSESVDPLDVNQYLEPIKEKERDPKTQGPILVARKLFPHEEFASVGYSRYPVQPGLTITEEQADQFLLEDATEKMNLISNKIPEFVNFPFDLRNNLVLSAYRGGITGSPKTINLINEGRFLEAADEFLDHEGYRRAKKDSNYTGIAPRMEALSQALRDYGNSLTE